MQELKNDIILLLRDYMNFLPAGQQEAYVPTGSGFVAESTWPLTEESLRRIDRKSMVGETYFHLDIALNRLNREHPSLYNAILSIYLSEESGHRDLDFLRSRKSKQVVDLVQRHDKAISKLAQYLKNADLYVTRPHKATGPKPGQDMAERHAELVAIFKRYHYDDELPYRQALNNAVLKMDGYYSRRHADRIVKAKLDG